MGIPPKVWGRGLWAFLHSVSYAKETRAKLDALHDLLTSLRRLLPCAVCRAHYARFVDARGLPEADAIDTWLVDLHNDVNRRAGKPTYTYAQARERWLTHPQPDCDCEPGARGRRVQFVCLFVFTMVVVVVLLVLGNGYCTGRLGR